MMETALVSPTAVTNSIRRPKSPRMPHRPVSASPVSQESSQPGRIIPTRSMSRGRSEQLQQPELVPTPSPQRERSKSRERKAKGTQKASPRRINAEKQIRGCVRGGFEIGRKMTECVAMTTDIYKSECLHRDRGSDSMFLGKSVSTESSEDNSIRVKETDEHQERDANQGHRRRASRDIIAPSDEDHEIMFHNDTSARRRTNPDDHRPLSRTSRDIRRPRGAYEYRESPQAVIQDPVGENYDLREVRMELFRQNSPNRSQNNPRSSPSRFAQALEEVAVQEAKIEELEKELKETRQELNDLKASTAANAKDGLKVRRTSSLSAGTEEKLFNERVEVEKKLREQLLKNAELEDQLVKQKEEAEKARKSMESWRLEARKHAKRARVRLGNQQKVDTSPETDEDEPYLHSGDSDRLDHAVMALKTENIDLKARIAEINAQSLSLKQSNAQLLEQNRQKTTEIESLQNRIAAMRSQLGDLKIDQEDGKAKEETDRLRDEIELVKAKLANSEKARSEISVSKAKLEEELTEVQDEKERLRSQVSRFMSELAKTREEADKNSAEGDKEVKDLVAKLKSTKSRLSETHANIVNQAEEHSKVRREMEESLARSRREAAELKRKVLILDEQMSGVENKSLADTIDCKSAASGSKEKKELSEADNAVMELLRQRTLHKAA